MISDERPVLQPEDTEFFARELDAFVPDRVFDAHTHLWTAEYETQLRGISVPETITGAVGYDEYRRLINGLHPGRACSALFLPKPLIAELAPRESAWLAEQVKLDQSCRALYLARPGDDPEWLRGEVRRLGLHGLKCYHVLSHTTPTWEADIPDYLPERLVAVANEEAWVITLHMVKARAVADPINQYWIRHYCERYPRIKLILAHCARSFQPAHALEGLPLLADLPNLFVDTSAVCDAMAIQAVLRIMGPHRVLYGSDFCASFFRGRSVAVADSFLWLYGDSPVWKEKHRTLQPVLIALEALRALKWACWGERLNDHQVEGVFWDNAAALFEVGS